MKNRIIVLDEILASKIAAGEVIERPASVVKELIENSIDSGADRIDIEVHSGGKALIRVTDDGSGMNELEALTSLERHATSKIKNADDLFNISSLGFRGEALPSIASVSKLEMITNDADKATFIAIEGGKIIDKKEFAAPYGTSIIVKDLFFNTPVRQKFMKSDGCEMSHISDIVSKFIIGYPEIVIKLSSNGREILSSGGSLKAIDTIASVYGAEFAKNLLKFKSGNFEGFIGKPQETKLNREYQLFFVNNRVVRNHLLSKAVEDAFLNLIPRDRKPASIIFIKIDPAEIDVNVHPSKKEIKLLKPKEIMSSLTNAIKEALIDEMPQNLISSPVVQDIWQEQMVQPTLDMGNVNSELQTVDWEPVCLPADRHDGLRSAVPDSPFHPVPLAQLDLTYIICLDSSGLILIDQHAAHERILYEKIKSKKISSGSSQVCLIEEIIELTSKEFANMEENLEPLLEIGFDIEVFGKNTLRIKAVPSEITENNIKKLVCDIILGLEEMGRSLILEDKREKIAKLVACHGAIKAGDKLTFDSMKILIKDLYSITNPSTCPHGRPSIVKLDTKDIAKFFDR